MCVRLSDSFESDQHAQPQTTSRLAGATALSRRRRVRDIIDIPVRSERKKTLTGIIIRLFSNRPYNTFGGVSCFA